MGTDFTEGRGLTGRAEPRASAPRPPAAAPSTRQTRATGRASPDARCELYSAFLCALGLAVGVWGLTLAAGGSLRVATGLATLGFGSVFAFFRREFAIAPRIDHGTGDRTGDSRRPPNPGTPEAAKPRNRGAGAGARECPIDCPRTRHQEGDLHRQ